jgi:DNA-directed RNA polymerases I and III subunit RPAC1
MLTPFFLLSLLVVYSNMMRFVHSGDQDETYPEGISLVHGDILITQLRPGQEIEASCYAHKGIGRDHAKWSPVCPASYQLLPEIAITKPIEGAHAEQLVKTCPMGVFDIEDMGKKAPVRARVKNPRNCTVCRECIRDKDWADQIKITRKRDHFICTQAPFAFSISCSSV